eukprot:scaffold23_cov113-Isochrysis_galbana.AAC.5
MCDMCDCSHLSISSRAGRVRAAQLVEGWALAPAHAHDHAAAYGRTVGRRRRAVALPGGSAGRRGSATIVDTRRRRRVRTPRPGSPDATEFALYLTLREVLVYLTLRELSVYLALRELSVYLALRELSVYLALRELSVYLALRELSGGLREWAPHRQSSSFVMSISSGDPSNLTYSPSRGSDVLTTP